MLVDLVRRLCGRPTPAASRPAVEPVLPWLPVPEPTPQPMRLREPVVRVASRPEPAGRPAVPESRTHRRAEPVPVAAATPRRRRRRSEPGALSPAMHARRLLHWCQTEGGQTGEILAADLVEIYHNQCAYDLLEPLPWQPVAIELRRLLNDDKPYRWVVRDGERHRLRVYRIPPLSRGDFTFLEFHDWLARETAPEPVRLRRAA